jgi:succinate dehydrogenase hydrophobic anchor subunit
VRSFKEREKPRLLTQPDFIETEIRELLVDFILRDDKQLSDTLPIWRGFFGEERNRLFHLGVMLDYIRRMLDIPRVARPPVETWTTSSEKHFSKKMEIVETAWQSLNKRMDGTYQAVMSTMSIIESDRAVKEAEAVTKLTNLAFFFIPLSLVAAILAMPLKEFEGSKNLKVWLWVTVSLSVMTITYSILYWKNVVRFTQAAIKYLKTFEIDKLKTLLFFLFSAGVYLFLFLICLGVVAVGGIGVWKIVTDHHLSEAAKGVLSFIVVVNALALGFACLGGCLGAIDN